MDMFTQFSFLGLVAISGLLGALVGTERAFSGKSAGIRTHMFVATAATAIVLLANYILEYFAYGHPFFSFQSDPIRVIQAILIGFSFIGAGLIFKDVENGHIHNLTTAASMFLTTAIGIAVAMHLLYFAIGLTIFIVCANILFIHFEKIFLPRSYSKNKE